MKSKPKCTKEEFLKCVENHGIEIIKDDGVYRHIRFKKHDSYYKGFDLVTWPWHLCFTGEMGTYVFRCTDDMFEFFRPKQNEISINPSYWSEKCISEDRDGVRRYSTDVFVDTIIEWRNSIICGQRNRDNLKQFCSDFISSVNSDLLYDENENDDDAHLSAGLFKFIDSNGKVFRISDAWELDFTDFTYRFLWCCYAIVWGIAKYDTLKEIKND